MSRTTPLPNDTGTAKPFRLDLAVKLFDEEAISLGKASRLAGMPPAAFMDHLRSLGIPVARPAPGELEEELTRFG
jgi:predicted HTH domain antitoxin